MNSYKDYSPANARIVVDYDAPPKERVKFGYPLKQTYKQALWRAGYGSFAATEFAILFIFLILLIPAFIGFYIGIFTSIVATGKIGLVITAAQNAYNTTPMSYSQYLVYQQELNKQDSANKASSILLVILIFAWFGIPALITYYYQDKPKELAEITPKLNYWSARVMFKNKYLKITPEMVYENKAVIPNFHNVYLDYKTSGDFHKYLKKVEVLEYPYNYQYMNWKGKLSKKIVNQYQWRAFFTFSKTPKNGYIKVTYH